MHVFYIKTASTILSRLHEDIILYLYFVISVLSQVAHIHIYINIGHKGTQIHKKASFKGYFNFLRPEAPIKISASTDSPSFVKLSYL